MQTIKQLFKAGIPTLVGVRGNTFLIQSTDQGNNLEVDFMQRGAFAYRVMTAGAGFKARPQHGFDGLTITAPVDTNVQFIVTDGDIDLQITSTQVVVGNANSAPVPVKLMASADTDRIPVDVGGATINVTATNVGILQAAAITENAPVAAPAFTGGSPNQVALLAVSAGRRRVAFRNAGTGLAYIGGAGVTPTNAVIVLNPGDVWNDNDGAPAAWYGTSDTGTTINVQVMA